MSGGPSVHPAGLPAGAQGWFTGAADREDPPVGTAGNLSHRRPHQPRELAADRGRVGAATGTDPASWVLVEQVHGADVAVVDAATPAGAELGEADAVLTRRRDVPVGVFSADCVPVLLATPDAVAAVHAGRRGVVADVVGATLAHLGGPLTAVVGPAIGGCCYEVPERMRDDVVAEHPAAAAVTTWGTPSLDLPRAVEHRLRAAGAQVTRVGGCTRCHPGWFSHRADPTTGRQLALVVRR